MACGIDELSVTPAAVLPIRKIIRRQIWEQKSKYREQRERGSGPVSGKQDAGPLLYVLRERRDLNRKIFRL